MITINLLPHHLRPIKRTPLPYLASLALLILALLVMAMLFLNSQSAIRSAQREYKDKEDELAALSDIVEEFNQLSEEKLRLEEKITIIKESSAIASSGQNNSTASPPPHPRQLLVQNHSSHQPEHQRKTRQNRPQNR